MPNPAVIGKKLYKDKICGEKGYNLDWGAAVAGVIGGQGSVKTACCLDIAEKKMEWHPDERIFWHDTVGSPCQYMKLQKFPYKIFVEDGLSIEFINATKKCHSNQQVTYFSGIDELYDLAECQMLNVVYFKSVKSWVGFFNEKGKQGLIEYLMRNHDWQTIIFDEMESVFPADVNNQTEEQWWTWTNKVASEKIKECRKSRVSVIGNYHNPNAIYHSVLNKFMFRLWGFGSRPRGTRVGQSAVDKLSFGEFWVDHQGTIFGKIKVETIYKPPKNEIVCVYK